ncbi:Rossmann-like and DUF2520 domain-containing protein [Ferruginibacter yonginensis]|uniref:Rossmann-like and DUF2520 domain-containing protein n=1 Tax=Ferruginibacter yonginensis TaxID=1310416 RepID=A0ABV8QMK1_9BACT
MNISFIGTGNVASVLAKACNSKGHIVHQIIGRNVEAGTLLAKEVGANFYELTSKNIESSELIIVATSDRSISDALSSFNFGSTPTVHTAGSVSIDILKNVSDNYGVLYPLQSLRKEMEAIPCIPFIVEANNTFTENILVNFAKTISEQVEIQTEAQRLRLHTAGVIVSNFTNYLYGITENFCVDEHINFDLLKPLISETANRITHLSPKALQTGPAIRGDIATLDKHLRLLSTYPKLRTLYMRMTDGIMNP